MPTLRLKNVIFTLSTLVLVIFFCVYIKGTTYSTTTGLITAFDKTTAFKQTDRRPPDPRIRVSDVRLEEAEVTENDQTMTMKLTTQSAVKEPQLVAVAQSWLQQFEDLKQQLLQVQPQTNRPVSSPQSAFASRPPTSIPRMLFMTRPTRDWDPTKYDPSLNLSINSNCPYKCEYTVDRTRLSRSDGVFIQPSEIQSNFPRRYSPAQTFFLFFREAPGQAYMKNFKWLPPNQINFTVGWFPGADIHSGYDELVPRQMHYFGRPNRTPRVTNEEAEWKEVKRVVMAKSKPGFALISHCNTNGKRELYLNEMQKRHPKFLHLFGKCYNESACKTEECVTNNIRDYHFYFAFENTVCDGYVTEKFFRLKKLIVPVVLRKSDYLSLAPEGSYIAIDQFESMDAVANHLEFLMSNKTEYLKYFEWTRNFERGNPNSINRALCKSCAKLYEPGRKSTYRDMAEWYSPKRLCDFEFVSRLFRRHTQLGDQTPSK